MAHTMVKKLQNCPFPWRLRHPPGGGLSHGHKHMHKDRACGLGDMLMDTYTHTNTSQTCTLQYFSTAAAGKVVMTIIISLCYTTSITLKSDKTSVLLERRD